MKPTPSATTSTPSHFHTSDPPDPLPSKETIISAPPPATTPSTSPTFNPSSKTPSRRVLRLKCPTCSDYPDGFRSEHELRRHTNRVHRKTRKVWMTIDTSPDKSFLANCKACQTGKRYNECYNAASHLRRMHFHPHKRGERKMTAAEARRGGKPGDLDPPMDVLKSNWLREVDEVIGEGAADDDDVSIDDGRNDSVGQPSPQPQSYIHVEPRRQPQPPLQSMLLPQPPPLPPQPQPQPQAPLPSLPQPQLLPQPPQSHLQPLAPTQQSQHPQPALPKPESKAPPSPTTPSTRSMAIDSIVDKVNAS